MLKLRRHSTIGVLGVLALAVPGITLLVPAHLAGAATDRATVTCDPVAATEAAPEPTLLSFDPQLPERIIDTRDATGGVDAPLDAGCTLVVDMSGIAADEVEAFALSVTVISPERGFFTAFPCAGGQPGTSSVNARPGIPTPNLVVGVPDSAGMLCLFSETGGNVIIDVSGWWADGTNRFTPIEPSRAYDTRTLDDPVKLPADAVRDIEIAGVVVPDDAVSISLNVAVVAPEEDGFLVVYPCGFPVPLASNLNFVAGEKRAVTAIVDLGPKTDLAASGRLCVSTSATTHFLVDVTGYDAPSSTTSPDVFIEPVADTRIVDTRFASVPGSRFADGSTQRFDLSSVIDRPEEAVAVILNAVAVQAETGSFASITPCTDGPPTTSSLNYDLDQTANLVVTALSPETEFCVYADTAVDMVIDLVGVVTGSPGSLVNQLSFSEVDGTLLPLDQPFEIEAADYTTTCDGERTARLRLGLAPQVTALVNGVEVADRDPVAPDLPITLADDGLTTVELERGTESATYYVRCLPPDFPLPNVEVDEGAAPGWYLTNLPTPEADRGEFLAILNERGAVVWYQRLDQNLIDAKLSSTGDIIAATNPRAFTVDPTEGHRIVALDGTLIDVRVGDDDAFPVDKHDFVEIPDLPEGRAIISYPLQPNIDLSDLDPEAAAAGPAALQCDVGDPMNPLDNGVIDEFRDIVGGSVREVSGDNTLVWEWDAGEHFSVAESRFPLCFKNYPDANPVEPPRDPAGEVDLFHLNSLFRVVEDGCTTTCDYVVSARHLDAVFRIDRDVSDPDGELGPLPAEEGYVEWILSSTETTPLDEFDNPTPNIYGDVRYDAPRLNIIDDPLGGPLRPHDARLDGDILTMHDNRSSSGQTSRFVAYQIDTTTSTDPADWTATLIRQIDAPNGATSGSLGSARLADDGSVLMGWGAVQPVLVEYAADDTELLRVAFETGVFPYRVVKYEPDVFDVDELRATAGNTTQAPSV